MTKPTSAFLAADKRCAELNIENRALRTENKELKLRIEEFKELATRFHRMIQWVKNT